jgi:hypothetical protein
MRIKLPLIRVLDVTVQGCKIGLSTQENHLFARASSNSRCRHEAE